MIKKIPFSPFSFPESPQRFVYFAAPTGSPGSAEAEEEDEKEQQKKIEAMKAQEREQSQRAAAASAQIDSTRLSAFAKQRLREAIASDDFEAQQIAERFLLGDRELASEQTVLEALNRIDEQNESWKKIFDTQRGIRKKIQELQYKTESYVELIPRHKKLFETLLGDVKKLNRDDAATETQLVRELGRLSADPDPAKPGAGSVLTKEAAKEIYLASPLENAMFDRIMEKHRGVIEAHPAGGKFAFKRLVALKKEEARTEQQFKRRSLEADKLIASNMSRVRRKAERKHILKLATASTGITMEEGVELDYYEPAADVIGARKAKAKIARIEVKEEVIRDHEGNAIGTFLGAPVITLSRGPDDENKTMTLGRFKKWADAVDAVEVIPNLAAAEKAAGLADFDLHIEKGMVITYPRRKRDPQTGAIQTVPEYIRVEDITNEGVKFDSPVLFQPGFGNHEDDYRDFLNFGEFAKWWHRYEVEKSMGLEELQSLLQKHNERENKSYGIEPKENPPILVRSGEQIRYPDEDGLKFFITKVDPDGLYLDTGEKFTFPEFFYWVKNNQVEKVPEKEPDAKELKDIDDRHKQIELEKDYQEIKKELKLHTGAEHQDLVIQDTKSILAGSPIKSLARLWHQTQFLSLSDLWDMTKEVVEFVKRKHERRSKGRFGEVGSRLPWVVGTEFERIKQEAETGEVGKYKEAMEHWSIEKVKKALHETSSKDEAKAALQVLIHKGEMRWDDHEFWETLNRLTSRYTLRGTELYIPPPEKMPRGESGEDMSIRAVDALWGEGMGSEWFMENTGKYNSVKKNFEYKFKQLENDPKGTGGPGGECERMLKDWVSGKYVNAQEYEAMIEGALEFGKMTAEKKMFYLIAGVVARQGNADGKHPHGETLLHIDRVGELDSKFLNRFPLLDYFTQEERIDPYTGKERRLQFSDYEEMVNKYFKAEFKKCKPGANFSYFLWEVMLPSESVRTRISKGIRNATDMDHDDTQLFIPLVAPSEIDQLTQVQAGQKRNFSNEGYANVYPGFNQWILTTSYLVEASGTDEEKQKRMLGLQNAISSFIRYDAVIDYRFLKKDMDNRARLDTHHFKRHPVVDGMLLEKHQAQLRNIVVKVGKAYGQDWSWLYGAKTGSWFDPKERAKQEEYERKLDSLKDVLARLFAQDGGERALEVVKQARAVGEIDPENENALGGLKSSRRPTPEKFKAMQAEGLEYIAHAGEGGHP